MPVPRTGGDGARSGLRLRLVGRFTVERDGVVLGDHQVGSRKARLVLKVLAAARGRTVANDVLAEAVWGDRPPAQVDANLATLVSRLRGTLGRDLIDGARGGYRLAAGAAVHIDVDDAERLLDEAEARLAAGHPGLALAAARAAREALEPGEVLVEEAGAEWAADLARGAARLARRARAVTWQASLALGDPRTSLVAATDAIAADPLDEEAHRAVMLAYHRLGEPGEALAAYARLRAVLVDELGADPGPETAALYEAILRGEAVPAPDAPAPLPRDRSADEPAFVAREHELDGLVDRWAEAMQGRSSCVVITGEAGIGKTRLASELARRAGAGGALVLWARCYEAERSLFLQPIVELVRTAVAGLAPDAVRRAAGERAGPLAALVAEVGPVLRPLGYEPASGEIERRRSFEAVGTFLGGLARQRPVLVVLDDVHEAGASTIELVHFTLRWDRTAPLLVVATARSERADAVVDQLGSLADVVELGGLPEVGVRSLAQQSGVPEAADAVMDLTRGHTLFVVEALRALVEAGRTTDTPGGGRNGGSAPGAGWPVPSSLRTAVTQRVRRCGPEVEEMLRAAVVVGSSFDPAHVAAILAIPVDEAARRGDVARQARLLVEDGPRYQFANDLIRDVVYGTTPAPLRAVRHRRLATLLADRPEAAAGHAAAAGDWAAAAAGWLAAAKRAADAFANREAEELLTRALDASAQVHEPALAADIRLARGRVRMALGHYAEATSDLTIAHQIAGALGAGAGAVEAAALTELGWAAYFARDGRRAHELAERAAAHPSAGPRARILVGRMRNADGDLAGSLAELEPLGGSAPDPAVRALALSCLGTTLTHSDRYADAVRVSVDAVEACRRTGALRGMLNARFFGAMARANLGDFGAALAWVEQLLGDVRRFDAAFYHPRGLNVLAWIRRELGDLAQARALAEEAFVRCEHDGVVEGEPAANALLALAESALLEDDEGEALRRLGEVENHAYEVGFGWRIDLRRLELLARIESGRAEDLLERARRHGSAKYEALALAGLGASEEAHAAAARTGSPWLLARVGPEAVARRALDQLAARLPPDLRAAFIDRGPLARHVAAL